MTMNYESLLQGDKLIEKLNSDIENLLKYTKTHKIYDRIDWGE